MVNWFLGERFHLRTALAEGECRRRIGLYSSDGLIPSVTDDPVAFFKWNRLHVGVTHTWRGPWLVGKMRSTGAGTEVIGRTGADYMTFWSALGFFVLILWTMVPVASTDPAMWAVLFVPVLFYVARRPSRHGERLIDFLQDLLDAEDVRTRTADPIARA
jgi:hypothetical protein